MLTCIKPLHRVVLLAALVAVLSATALASASLPVCATPQPQGPAYAAGTTNTITWAIPNTPTGSSYDIEVATASDVDPDGSFVDANLEQSAPGVPASERGRDFAGLEERTYYYHMRSRAKTNTCTMSPWSAVISTTQDATSPDVEITTQDDSVHVLEIVLEGFAIDPDPDSSASASGAGAVAVTLTPMTPLGALVFTNPVPGGIATVEDDGSWEATIANVNPGIYEATATVSDNVGNVSEESSPVRIIVVNAGVPSQPEQ